jgi:hypothetical protein
MMGLKTKALLAAAIAGMATAGWTWRWSWPAGNNPANCSSKSGTIPLRNPSLEVPA